MFRNLKQWGRWLAIAVGIGLLCSVVALAAKPPKLAYQVLQLDLVDQGGVAYAESCAVDISDQGQVAGYVLDASGGCLPACWTISTVGGEVHSELNLLRQESTIDAAAQGINENGEIVGVGTKPDGQMVGLYWADEGAVPQELPRLVDHDESWAYAINKNGVICGVSVSDFEERAVVWRVREGVFECGPVELLPSQSHARAVALSDNDINRVARVVGAPFVPGGMPQSAVAWTVLDGDETLQVVDCVVLNDLGLASARGVNNDGAVCGWIQTETTREAVVWSGDLSQTLSIPRLYCEPAAFDINNKGVIVGTAANTKTTAPRAVIWSSVSASMVVLDQFLDDDSPFGILCDASAVNDSGTIVGGGWDGTGCTAFLAVRR